MVGHRLGLLQRFRRILALPLLRINFQLSWLRGVGAAVFFFGGVLPLVWFMVSRWFRLKPAQDATERVVVPPTVLAVADVPGHAERVFETAGEQ